MKKNILIFILITFFIASCSSNIANNPQEDARNMINQLISAAENNDVDAANEILGKYYEIYSKKDLADKVVFVKSVKDSDAYDENDVWRHFANSKEFQNSPNYIRYGILYKETEKEARRLGVW